MIRSLSICAGVMFSTAALAAQQAPVAPVPAPTAPPAAAAPSAAPKLICRSSPSLGSLTRMEKSCRTAAEWADLRLQTRQKAEQMQAQGIRNQ